jgi:hypothetical protein
MIGFVYGNGTSTPLENRLLTLAAQRLKAVVTTKVHRNAGISDWAKPVFAGNNNRGTNSH